MQFTEEQQLIQDMAKSFAQEPLNRMPVNGIKKAFS